LEVLEMLNSGMLSLLRFRSETSAVAPFPQ
jgi:hypothetical protein